MTQPAPGDPAERRRPTLGRHGPAAAASGGRSPARQRRCSGEPTQRRQPPAETVTRDADDHSATVTRDAD
ncbi:hypothetical protein NGM37_19000, partial [Streptomyces sp. TRM76130]|nr:hypothetical protein [Streptomyces sp. TRM76130]